MFDTTKIQLLYDHADHTRFHTVEMGCQMVQLLSADFVGPTMFVNLIPALLKDTFTVPGVPKRLLPDLDSEL